MTCSHPWQEKKQKISEAAAADKIEEPKDVCFHCRSILRAVRRAALFFQRLLRVVQWILEQRGKNSDEGQLAREWLNAVTAESACQLALVADATTDETMAVNRYFDQDTYSKADITVHMHKFLQKCTWLFGTQRGAMQTGYTALMLKTLEKPCNIFVDDGVRTLNFQ